MVSRHKEALLLKVGINEKRVAQIFLHFVAEKFLFFFIRDLFLSLVHLVQVLLTHTKTHTRIQKWELSS